MNKMIMSKSINLSAKEEFGCGGGCRCGDECGCDSFIPFPVDTEL